MFLNDKQRVLKEHPNAFREIQYMREDIFQCFIYDESKYFSSIQVNQQYLKDVFFKQDFLNQVKAGNGKKLTITPGKVAKYKKIVKEKNNEQKIQPTYYIQEVKEKCYLQALCNAITHFCNINNYPMFERTKIIDKIKGIKNMDYRGISKEVSKIMKQEGFICEKHNIGRAYGKQPKNMGTLKDYSYRMIEDIWQKGKQKNIIGVFDLVSTKSDDHSISCVKDNFFDSNQEDSFNYTRRNLDEVFQCIGGEDCLFGHAKYIYMYTKKKKEDFDWNKDAINNTGIEREEFNNIVNGLKKMMMDGWKRNKYVLLII